MRERSGSTREPVAVSREEYQTAKPLDQPPTPHATLWFDGLTFRLGDGNVPGILVRHGLVRIGCKAISVAALRELVKRLPDDEFSSGALIQKGA